MVHNFQTWWYSITNEWKVFYYFAADNTLTHNQHHYTGIITSQTWVSAAIVLSTQLKI